MAPDINCYRGGGSTQLITVFVSKLLCALTCAPLHGKLCNLLHLFGSQVQNSRNNVGDPKTDNASDTPSHIVKKIRIIVAEDSFARPEQPPSLRISLVMFQKKSVGFPKKDQVFLIFGLHSKGTQGSPLKSDMSGCRV